MFVVMNLMVGNAFVWILLSEPKYKRRLDTVDFRTSAGEPQEERKVQVIHLSHPTQGSKTSEGVLAGAVAVVVTDLKSAKGAISKM